MAARAIGRLAVANRGEIARRIFRTAHRLGIETVGLFADDDRAAPFVAEADWAIRLGAPEGDGPVRSPYLDVRRVVDAALGVGADALHPGYGFLAEDPELATAVEEAGLIWVGPPAAAMRIMGHKTRAKAAVAEAGVPVLPSRVLAQGEEAPADEVLRLATEVGFPLLVKAAAGGGGRGMRFVDGPEELQRAVESARREAQAAFGSDEVFLERFAPEPRHVEVQVLADVHGAVVHLFDRDCSVQRRHQKLVEEAPAIQVEEPARRRMWEAAVAAARAVGYVGVGTVEFIVGQPAGAPAEVAFLEMNTRLQVEHGVTELVTGLDLVELQLAVAAGHPLPFGQDEVTLAGHAVEVRLCAESPRHDHRPTPGRILHARWPEGGGVRTDPGVESGSVVGTAYDSLLAKVMAVAPDRQRALGRLGRALRAELEFDGDEGLETNRLMLTAILDDPDYVAGRVTTEYLDRHPRVVGTTLGAGVRRRHAAAAALFLEQRRSAGSLVPGVAPGWRNVGAASHLERFSEDDDRLSVGLERRRGRLTLLVEGPGDLAAPLGSEVGAAVTIEPGGASGIVALEADGILVEHRVRTRGSVIAVNGPEGQSTLTLLGEEADGQVGGGSGELRAPLPGSVTEVRVKVGDLVEVGSALVVLEAMKMEHTLRAPLAARVVELTVAPGQQVDTGELLVRLAGEGQEDLP